MLFTTVDCYSPRSALPSFTKGKKGGGSVAEDSEITGPAISDPVDFVRDISAEVSDVSSNCNAEPAAHLRVQKRGEALSFQESNPLFDGTPETPIPDLLLCASPRLFAELPPSPITRDEDVAECLGQAPLSNHSISGGCSSSGSSSSNNNHMDAPVETKKAETKVAPATPKVGSGRDRDGEKEEEGETTLSIRSPRRRTRPRSTPGWGGARTRPPGQRSARPGGGRVSWEA